MINCINKNACPNYLVNCEKCERNVSREGCIYNKFTSDFFIEELKKKISEK